MPEGHTIHRAARDQGSLLIGNRLAVMSPQGRFRAGAAQIDGAACKAIEAVGKHLLYHFENGRSLHIHLGLAGRFYRFRQPVEPPREVVRVRLESPSAAIDITGPAICEILGAADLETMRARYGPDVLAETPDPERAIAKIRASRAAIGTLLMNQRVISGIGNIYRSEILWLLRIHPLTRGCDIQEDTLRALWEKMRALMMIGVEYNSIITNGDLPKAGQDVVERVNIFAQTNCPRCDGDIEVSKLNARTLYHCPACQAP